MENESTTKPSEAPSSPTEPKKKSGVKLVVGIIIAVVVLGIIAAVIGIVVFVGALSGPSKIAKQQLEAIDNENFQAAYDLGSAEFKDAVTVEDVQAISTTAGLTEMKDVSFSSTNILNDTALLIGTFTPNTGEAFDIVFQLVRENDEWRVVFFEIAPDQIRINSLLEEYESSDDDI